MKNHLNYKSMTIYGFSMIFIRYLQLHLNCILVLYAMRQLLQSSPEVNKFECRINVFINSNHIFKILNTVYISVKRVSRVSDNWIFF